MFSVRRCNRLSFGRRKRDLCIVIVHRTDCHSVWSLHWIPNCTCPLEETNLTNVEMNDCRTNLLPMWPEVIIVTISGVIIIFCSSLFTLSFPKKTRNNSHVIAIWYKVGSQIDRSFCSMFTFAWTCNCAQLVLLTKGSPFHVLVIHWNFDEIVSNDNEWIELRRHEKLKPLVRLV